MTMKKETLEEFLYRSVKTNNWEEVIKRCADETEALSIELTHTKDTVLHLAVYGNQLEVVVRLVGLIRRLPHKDAIMKKKNDGHSTPLHVAAVVGCPRMCYAIASVNKELVNERNKDGETPLFLAVMYGHKRTFFCLYNFCKTNLAQVEMNCRRSNGDTILHSALKQDQFDLAFHFINMNNKAATGWRDGEGKTSLQVLATKPTAFKSGAHMNIFQSIVYYFFCVKELKPADSLATLHQEEKRTKQLRTASYFPANYATCIAFFVYLFEGFLMVINRKQPLYEKEEVDPCDHEEAEATDPETHESDPPSDTQLLKPPHETSSFPYPKNYGTCFNFLGYIVSGILIVCGLGFAEFRKLRYNKQIHSWSVQVMERLMELAPPDIYVPDGETPDSSHLQTVDRPYLIEGGSIAFNKDKMMMLLPPCFHKLPPESKDSEKNKIKADHSDSVMLLAAKNGVVEIVSRLFENFPQTIYQSDKAKKNVVLLAAEYCQPEVYKFCLKHKTQLESLFHAVDEDGNSALHLAARLKNQQTWPFAGAAFQMQWEVKWYEYVRDSVELNYFAVYNNEGKLAEHIFNETHKELVQAGRQWLNSTSEACSLVAGLVVTVAYTSMTTVPGGNESPFQNDMGFFLFSVTSLLGLCFSTTSMITFLGILTSRFNEMDFGSKLPFKLLIGHSLLFLSLVMMLASFCAGHYFLLDYYLPNIAVGIYLTTLVIVISVFLEMQLRLYYDLLNAILSKIPSRSNEVIAV